MHAYFPQALVSSAAEGNTHAQSLINTGGRGVAVRCKKYFFIFFTLTIQTGTVDVLLCYASWDDYNRIE